MDGVKEGLDVHAAFLTVARQNLNKAARKLLAVKGFRMKCGPVVEEEFLGNLLNACVQQDILFVQNDDRVDDVFKIPYLMGGNHYD